MTDLPPDWRRWTPLRKLVHLLSPDERQKLARLAPLLVAASLFETLSVATLMPFLGLLASPELAKTSQALRSVQERLGNPGQAEFLLLCGGAVLCTLTLSNLLSGWTTYRLQEFSWLRNHSLSLRLLVAYAERPYAFFLGRHSSDLCQSTLGEVTAVVSSVLSQGLQLLARGATVLLVLLALVIVNPWMAIGTACVFGGLYGLIYWAIRRRLAQLSADRVRANRSRYKIAAEFFQGIKEVKLSALEGAFFEAFSAPSLELARVQASVAVIGSVPRYALETVAFAGLLSLAMALVLTGRSGVEVFPLLGLYLFASYRMLPGLQAMFAGVTAIRSNLTALDSLVEEMNGAARVLPPPAPPSPVLPLLHELRLEGVSFSYEGRGQPALANVSFTIRTGEWIALVGTTGAGKSTLVDILLGLLEPTRGELVLDDAPLRGEAMAAWQRSCAYVAQSIFLADDSLARNIAFGSPVDAIDRPGLEQAARIAQLHEFVLELPEGYETRVGERGTRLSGGQRQRVGIARALYRRPRFLVLDEATSALDNETESRLLAQLRRELNGVTVISVAHRLSTTRSFDRILVLERGAIVDEGTYTELAMRSPLFLALNAETSKPSPGPRPAPLPAQDHDE